MAERSPRLCQTAVASTSGAFYGTPHHRNRDGFPGMRLTQIIALQQIIHATGMYPWFVEWRRPRALSSIWVTGHRRERRKINRTLRNLTCLIIAELCIRRRTEWIIRRMRTRISSFVKLGTILASTAATVIALMAIFLT
jgi:hypothetical protein